MTRSKPSQAKTSQAKVLTGDGDLRNSTSPCLLAIPAFDRIAGLVTDTLTLTGYYAYANDFKSG